MMTSKEALEQIKRDGVFLNSNGEIDSKRTCECFSDYCNKIKQDLELLEEYQNYYNKVVADALEKERLIREIKNQLEKENRELKEQLKLSNESQETVINTMNLVSQENEKLTKAIEIIKSKKVDMRYFLECVGVDTYNFWATKEGAKELTQQGYDLLKEVLGYEKTM